MKISSDEYELPEAIAGSRKELAQTLGISDNAIRNEVYKYEHGLTKKQKYIKFKDIGD